MPYCLRIIIVMPEEIPRDLFVCVISRKLNTLILGTVNN